MLEEMQHQVSLNLLPASDTNNPGRDLSRALPTRTMCTHAITLKAKPTTFILSFAPANTPYVIGLISLDPSGEDSLPLPQCPLPVLLVTTIPLYPAWEQRPIICINHD